MNGMMLLLWAAITVTDGSRPLMQSDQANITQGEGTAVNASEMNHIKQMPSTSASTAVAAVFHGLANVLHAAISPLAYWASMVLGVFTVDALEYVFPVTRRVHLLHNFPDILARRGHRSPTASHAKNIWLAGLSGALVTWFPVLLELIVLMVDRAFHGRLSTMMPPWTFLAVGVYFGLGMLLVVFVNLYGMALTLDLQPISQETGLVYVMVQKDVPCGPYNSNWFVYLVHTYLYVAGFLLFQALLLG